MWVNGIIRILAYSNKNIAFEGNEGTLFTLPIEVNGDMDECEITIKNILVTNINREEKEWKDVIATLPVEKVKPGDANGDGSISVTDITCIVDYIMEKNRIDVVFVGADANGDGKISVTDITEVVYTIMNEQ